MKISQAKYTGDGRGWPLDTDVNFWHPDMYNILEAAARTAVKRLGFGYSYDIEELVNVAWFKTGRMVKTYEDMKKYLYLHAIREVRYFLCSERRWRNACNYLLNNPSENDVRI